ncbi:MAG TPA: hypothetical protein VLN58_12225 [Verrucomicrobiae bacterium]|nr:hypothetical protein [Verrucomicrobiae bacterium]
MRRLEITHLYRKEEEEADQQHKQGNQPSSLAKGKHLQIRIDILPPERSKNQAGKRISEAQEEL